MSDDTITKTVWRVLTTNFAEDPNGDDILSMSLQANGKTYAVVVAGPRGMNSDEFIPALRAAAGVLIHACGGDVGEVGAAYKNTEDADGQTDLFNDLDTSKSRAN